MLPLIDTRVWHSSIDEWRVVTFRSQTRSHARAWVIRSCCAWYDEARDAGEFPTSSANKTRHYIKMPPLNWCQVQCRCQSWLPRDAMQARPMPSCGVHPSVCVCLSVTFVHSVKTNKHISNFFSPSCKHTILVFPYQTSWQCSDGDPLTGASNARGYKKNHTIFD